MPRVENGAVAFQAIFAAFCFAMGALLSSIGRGQENGAGNIGLQLDAGTCAYTTNNTGRMNMISGTVMAGGPSWTYFAA